MYFLGDYIAVLSIPVTSTSLFEHTVITFSEQVAKDDYLQLKQETIDLQEYSNAKLDRVTRYLGVLAEKTRKLGKIEMLMCVSNCLVF